MRTERIKNSNTYKPADYHFRTSYSSSNITVFDTNTSKLVLDHLFTLKSEGLNRRHTTCAISGQINENTETLVRIFVGKSTIKLERDNIRNLNYF